MRRCIWCLKNEEEKAFTKRAHTIPKALGGKNLNPNICDKCNEYFGSRNSKDGIAIEEIFKEGFNITRRRMQLADAAINPKKSLYRFKSRYFEIKEKKGKPALKIKRSFRFKPGFQIKLCRYFKRGLYKLYLEELNRQQGIGYENSYDFIREFARHDIGDYPVFYFERSIGFIYMFNGEVDAPALHFDRINYLVSDHGFVEIEFLGHVFGFPKTRLFELDFDNYLEKSLKAKRKFFKGMKPIRFLTDIDLTLSILND